MTLLTPGRVPTPAELAVRLSRRPRLTVTDSARASDFDVHFPAMTWPDGADEVLAQLRALRASSDRRYQRAGRTRSTR